MYIVRDGTYLTDLTPYFLLGLLLLLALTALRWRSPSRTLFAAIFGVYLLYAIRFTVFNIALFDGPRRSIADILSRIHLAPFDFGGDGLHHILITTLLLNIVLTIPFSFGIGFVVRLRRRDYRWVIPAIGVFFEACQLAVCLAIGSIYRTIDINDVILNMLGAAIGYGLFVAFAYGYRHIMRRTGDQPRAILAYVDAVARRITGESGADGAAA